jgi:hypothetical protein
MREAGGHDEGQREGEVERPRIWRRIGYTLSHRSHLLPHARLPWRLRRRSTPTTRLLWRPPYRPHSSTCSLHTFCILLVLGSPRRLQQRGLASEHPVLAAPRPRRSSICVVLSAPFLHRCDCALGVYRPGPDGVYTRNERSYWRLFLHVLRFLPMYQIKRRSRPAPSTSSHTWMLKRLRLTPGAPSSGCSGSCSYLAGRLRGITACAVARWFMLRYRVPSIWEIVEAPEPMDVTTTRPWSRHRVFAAPSLQQPVLTCIQDTTTHRAPGAC